MESPLEFHSQKPDTWVEDLCGFGCADRGPGRCFSTDRGFCFHGYIMCPLLAVFKRKIKYLVKLQAASV
jgi:hypothetical protein